MAHKLADAETRIRFLAYIEAGDGIGAAAKKVGATDRSVRRYRADNTGFRVVLEAALDAACEPVLAEVRRQALDGDLKAAALYLKQMGPTPRSEKQKNQPQEDTGPEATPEQLAIVATLQAALSPAPPPPIEIPYEETSES